MNIIEGPVVILGDGVSVNSILAPEYSLGTLALDIGEHIFPVIQRADGRSIQAGDILVAGEKFGVGAAREQVVLALQQVGIKAVVARSFAPAFFRNAINVGLPVFVSAETVDSIQTGDALRIDSEKWSITNLRTGSELPAEPPPGFIRKILEMGGVTAYMKEIGGQSTTVDGR